MSSSFSLFIDAHPVIFAGVFGIMPALLWLWFWLREDIHPEPTKLLVFTFLGGMLAVFVAIPLQQKVQSIVTNYTLLFFLWAAIEEILKWIAAYMGGIHTASDDEPVDAIIYMIVAALGFTAMENTLFLLDPLISGNIATTLITDNLRFIGATLLHVTSSAALGTWIAFSFHKSRTRKTIYALCGLILAVLLHGLFNLFILNGTTSGLFPIFGIVWACIVVLLFIFERTKSIPVNVTA